MRKILILFVLAFIAVTSFGQAIDGRTYTPFNNYYRWKGGIFDSTLLLPDGIPVTGRRPGAVRYSAADSTIYVWTGSQWKKAEPNLTGKLNVSDTAAMLSPYLREVDTASLSSRINLKLNISDTGSILSPYLRKIDTASLSNRINLKVGYTDTASMLTPYFRKSDTATISNRIDLKLNISDTAAMLSPYARINTVNAGLATKVNISDTSGMLTPYLRKVDTLSLSSRIDLRVRYSDTANMLSPYLNSSVAAATYQLILDTIPLAAFGAGSGAAGDTLAFSTSAVYGSFYNAGNDTLIITQMRAGVLGTSPSITTEVYWNDSLNITAGATILVSGGTSVTGTIGATNVTSFTNNKIPPNVWVFVRTSAVATKPTYFTLTLLGYKKRI